MCFELQMRYVSIFSKYDLHVNSNQDQIKHNVISRIYVILIQFAQKLAMSFLTKKGDFVNSCFILRLLVFKCKKVKEKYDFNIFVLKNIKFTIIFLIFRDQLKYLQIKLQTHIRDFQNSNTL